MVRSSSRPRTSAAPRPQQVRRFCAPRVTTLTDVRSDGLVLVRNLCQYVIRSWENKNLRKTSAIKVAASTGKVYQFHLPYSSPPSRVFSTESSGTAAEFSNVRATNMPAKMGWLRHVLTILSVVIFVSHELVINRPISNLDLALLSSSTFGWWR